MHGKHLCLYLRVISGITGWSFTNFLLSSFVWTTTRHCQSYTATHPQTKHTVSPINMFTVVWCAIHPQNSHWHPWELTAVRYSQKGLKSCSFSLYSKTWQTKPVRAGYSRGDKDYSVMVDGKKKKKAEPDQLFYICVGFSDFNKTMRINVQFEPVTKITSLLKTEWMNKITFISFCCQKFIS